MPEIDLYNSIRNEILINHVLMHLTTLVVVIILLAGIWLAERRPTVLTVFLPLLSLAWAASLVRFDFLIQRQGAYLRTAESTLQSRGVAIPLWESWKSSLASTMVVMPITDLLALSIVIITSAYFLFGPSKAVFAERRWPAHRVFSWSVLALICGLLGSLIFLPKMAAW